MKIRYLHIVSFLLALVAPGFTYAQTAALSLVYGNESNILQSNRPQAGNYLSLSPALEWKLFRVSANFKRLSEQDLSQAESVSYAITLSPLYRFNRKYRMGLTLDTSYADNSDVDVDGIQLPNKNRYLTHTGTLVGKWRIVRRKLETNHRFTFSNVDYKSWVESLGRLFKLDHNLYGLDVDLKYKPIKSVFIKAAYAFEQKVFKDLRARNTNGTFVVNGPDSRIQRHDFTGKIGFRPIKQLSGTSGYTMGINVDRIHGAKDALEHSLGTAWVLKPIKALKLMASGSYKWINYINQSSDVDRDPLHRVLGLLKKRIFDVNTGLSYKVSKSLNWTANYVYFKQTSSNPVDSFNNHTMTTGATLTL